MLYGCESWTVYQRYVRKLNLFHTTTLRKLLGIKWQDKIPDSEILPQGQPSQYPYLPDADPATLGRPCSSHARPSAPQETPVPRTLAWQTLPWKKRFKDTLKVSLKAFNISHSSWEQAAMKRRKWRAALWSGAESHEANELTNLNFITAFQPQEVVL